jgi:hypothetical protein
VRGVFLDEDDAAAEVQRLRADGYVAVPLDRPTAPKRRQRD